MSRSRTSRSVPRVTVLMCRGCCCGTAAKHPDTDHDAQEQAVSQAAAAHDDVRVRLVDCLDECDRSNVVVLRGSTGRAAQRDTWLGGVLGPRATEALASWVGAGADGPLPAALAGLRFPRRRPGRGATTDR